jgi:DNA-binding NarL/FixJ family response regulator
MSAGRGSAPESGPASRSLVVELSAETYGRLDRMAQALHLDAGKIAARWVDRGVAALWSAASIASCMGLVEGVPPTPRRRTGPGSNPRVTDDQLVRIRRLAGEGVPVTAIAAQVGVAVATVRRHAGKLHPAPSYVGARIDA